MSASVIVPPAPAAAPDPAPNPAPALAALRDGGTAGDITEITAFGPGLALRADPGLRVSGQYRSPAGRLLELELAMAAPGQWIALHVALAADDLSGAAWIGFACHSAAPGEVMVRPCLRSGAGDSFTDCFFPKHILAAPEPGAHVDALYLPAARAVPETAPWRELVLFLPRTDFVWHLHDLRLFVI